MDKKTPNSPLKEAQNLVKEGKVRETYSALGGAAALNMSKGDMHQVVLNLTDADFYKSMTAHHDDNVWHDVYKPKTSFGDLYVKLIVSNNVLIVSFKEK